MRAAVAICRAGHLRQNGPAEFTFYDVAFTARQSGKLGTRINFSRFFLNAAPDALAAIAVIKNRLKWALWEETCVHNIIYLVGLVVVVLAILSFFGLR